MYKYFIVVFLCFTLKATSQQIILSDYPSVDTARANYMLHQVSGGLKRSQIPKPPYHYSVEDCTFYSKETGLTYGATLTKPNGLKTFPTVVLISGTSPQDRDYTCDGHKYFWVLADYLSNHGIAVLRMDDRGVNQTTGNYKASTSLDFAKDMMAAVNWLNTRKDIDPRRIGLIGHSEGGILGPMTYRLDPSQIHFMVLIGGPFIGLRAINLYQSEAQFKHTWKTDSIVAVKMRLQRYIASQIPEHAHNEIEMHALLAKAIDTLCRTENPSILKKLHISNDDLGVDRLYRGYKSFLSPWWQYIMTYDPVTDIRITKCPVLGLFGANDHQVPPEEDYKTLKDNLPENHFSKVSMIPGMNHFMQPDAIGDPINYPKIATSIKPEVLNRITMWINSLPTGKP